MKTNGSRTRRPGTFDHRLLILMQWVHSLGFAVLFIAFVASHLKNELATSFHFPRGRARVDSKSASVYDVRQNNERLYSSILDTAAMAAQHHDARIRNHASTILGIFWNCSRQDGSLGSPSREDLEIRAAGIHAIARQESGRNSGP
jgi:hypothetical protein